MTTVDPSHPAHADHPFWQALLQTLQVLVTIAPVAAAPFIKNPQTISIVSLESQLAGGLIGGLQQASAGSNATLSGVGQAFATQQSGSTK
jgi:hypothetical protein